MNGWKSLWVVSILLVVAAIAIEFWEARLYRTTPASTASQSDTLTMTEVYAGGRPAHLPADEEKIHEQFSSYDIAEGKRLYAWFNCNTCHANGGGDIGPPLMDSKWLYGDEPRNIYASILQGRPNGMPSFRGKIPDAQTWQLVAYIESMSGHVPLYARPSRNDEIQSKPAENTTPTLPVVHGGSPSPDGRSTMK